MVLCLGSSTDVYLCVLHRVGFTLKNLPLTCSLWTSLSTQLCDGQTEIVSVITKRGFRPVHSNCAGQRSAPESLLLTACYRFWTVVGTRRATGGEEQVSVLWGVHSNGLVLHSHSASRLECGCFKLIAVALNPAFAALSFVLLPFFVSFSLHPRHCSSTHTPFWKGNTALYKSWCLLDCQR